MYDSMYLTKLFLNNELKDILPFIVFVFCSVFIKNLITLISKNKIDRKVNILVSIALTSIIYIVFIKVVGLARYTYILDVIPLALSYTTLLLGALKDISLLIFILVTSNTLKISLYQLGHNCSLAIYYEFIKNLLVEVDTSILSLIKDFKFYLSNLIISNQYKYKVNCNFIC